MDQDLKNYLDAKFGEVNAKFGEVDMKFAELEDRLVARIETRIGKSEAAMEVRIAELVEKSENNLLRAFHGWARAMEIRVRGVSSVAVGFEERLSMVEERISEVERRKAS
jgi:hypothetical protein